jgi:acetoin utilization deacetylase AcuC-like enzyme
MLKTAFAASYVHPLPENHRFPMEKYDLLHRQLLYEGTLETSNIFEPSAIDEEWILKVHDGTYLNNLVNLELSAAEQRKSGFFHSKELIEREFAIMEGTRLCCQYALEFGVAMNIAGGTHHAFRNRGEGFCLLNDFAIAASWLMHRCGLNKILIIDLDVHQGNGTASIFQNESRVFTFSMHGANNYPMHKETSDIDIELQDGIEDAEYLYLLKKNLNQILSEFTPQFIFYQCGVDILNTDKLGKLNISLQGCKERDNIVFHTAKSLGVPVVCAMGGGYSQDIKVIVEAHANTFRCAQNIFF